MELIYDTYQIQVWSDGDTWLGESPFEIREWSHGWSWEAWVETQEARILEEED